jgi:hypothetical protein
MKNAYIAMLIGLAVLGIVYAGKEQEKTKDNITYKPIEIGKLPVFMEVGRYVELREPCKIQIKLEQVDCPSGRRFPCYKGSVTIKVRANFPAILSASLNKSGGDVDMLKEINLYWEDGVNTIQACTGEWQEFKLCLETWDVDDFMTTAGTVKVGEITINAKPEDTKSGD